jgi:hypothetical protein
MKNAGPYSPARLTEPRPAGSGNAKGGVIELGHADWIPASLADGLFFNGVVLHNAGWRHRPDSRGFRLRRSTVSVQKRGGQTARVSKRVYPHH